MDEWDSKRGGWLSRVEFDGTMHAYNTPKEDDNEQHLEGRKKSKTRMWDMQLGSASLVFLSFLLSWWCDGPRGPDAAVRVLVLLLCGLQDLYEVSVRFHLYNKANVPGTSTRGFRRHSSSRLRCRTLRSSLAR